MSGLLKRTTIKVSHGAMLAFVGWYLMMPPMAAERRPECSGGAAITMSELFFSLLAGTNPREYRLKRCDQLNHSVDAYAPMASWPDIMSTWRKIGEYDTLLQCDAQYQKNQTLQVDSSAIQNTSLSELIQEETKPISKGELEDRISEIKKGTQNQIQSERCIASDPNLAKD